MDQAVGGTASPRRRRRGSCGDVDLLLDWDRRGDFDDAVREVTSALKTAGMSVDAIAGRRVLFDQCPHDFAAAVLFGVPAPFRADRVDDQQPAPAFVVGARAPRSLTGDSTQVAVVWRHAASDP